MRGKSIKVYVNNRFLNVIRHYTQVWTQWRILDENLNYMIDDLSESTNRTTYVVNWEEKPSNLLLEEGINILSHKIKGSTLVIYDVTGNHRNMDNYKIDAELMKINTVRFVNFHTTTTSQFGVKANNVIFDNCSKIPMNKHCIQTMPNPDYIIIMNSHLDDYFDMNKIKEFSSGCHIMFKRCTFHHDFKLLLKPEIGSIDLRNDLEFNNCDFTTSEFNELIKGCIVSSISLRGCRNANLNLNFVMFYNYKMVKFYKTRKVSEVVQFLNNMFIHYKHDTRKKMIDKSRPITGQTAP